MFIFTVLLTFCVGASIAAPSGNGGRVVNGTDTDIEDWPYMVSVRARNSHSCGGTVIHPFWVLTAAHCTQSATPNYYTIRHSATNLLYDIDDRTVNIAEVINHPNYNPSQRYIHDISLIRLSTPISLPRYAILPQQFEDVEQDTPATLIGWGLDETGGTVQTHLQAAELIVFSDEECRRRHSVNPPHESNICGGVPEGGRGQCSGDSGGPLITRGVEVGIVSWSVKPCTVYPYPGVYTQVSYYREWIRQQTGA